MMRMWLSVLAVFVTTSAHAQGSDGYIYVSTVKSAELASQCATEAETSLTGDFCTGYLVAVLDTLSTNKIICPGPGFSTIQAVVIGRRYLAGHPEQWSYHPSWILSKAYKSAFACRKR